MALGPGISYIDWVEKSGSEPAIAFTLKTGTELITIENLRTVRPRQISRITPSSPVGGLIEVGFDLVATDFTDNNNNYGMSIGCVSLINHNIPMGHPFKFTVTLLDSVGATIYSNTSVNYTTSYRNAKIYHLFDQVYTEVKTASISIKIAHDGTYQFNDDFELGRLWVGNYLETCFESGYSFSHASGGKPFLSIGNDAHIEKKRARQSMPFDFALINDNDVIYNDANWYNLSQEVSTDSNILILPRVEDVTVMQKLCTYGYLKREPVLTSGAGVYWSASLDVVELV